MTTYFNQTHGVAQTVNVLDTINSVNNQNDSDGWFVSYADILLLLLTFFVLLFAFSRVEGVENSADAIEATEKALEQSGPSKLLLSELSSREIPKEMAAQRLAEPLSERVSERATRPVSHVVAVMGEGGVSIVHEPITDVEELAVIDGIMMDVLYDETPVVQVEEPTIVAIAAPFKTEIHVDGQQSEISQLANQAIFERDNEAILDMAMYETGPANSGVDATQPNLLVKANVVALTVDEQLAKLSAGLTSSEVEVSAGYQSINIELSDKVLFPLGEAQLLEEGRFFLNEIAAIMATNDYFTSVEGHTDNTPIATPTFPSNWELSSSRATSVARYLIDQGVASNRLRAIGYADTQPKVENNSSENRARNRRVSITFHYDRDAPLS